MKNVLEFLKENAVLCQDDYVVIGLSGGPDSMALLHNLLEYRQVYHFNIVCAHVHHNYREESDEEAKFVEKYCYEHNVIFEMTKLKYQENFSEALAHKMRYQYFDKIMNKYDAKYLFTAHHGDDLVETILMRLVRGSNLNGYKGFDSVSKRNGYIILRPLITSTKEEILTFLEKKDIPYVLDKSNFDINFTRNRFRKNILPKLKEENSDVHIKFFKFSNLLNEYNNYIDVQVENAYQKVVQNNIINIRKLKEQDKLIIKLIINKWLYGIYRDDINLITDVHVDNIINMIKNEKPNLVISLPNYNVIKSYEQIYLKNMIDYEYYEYVLKDKVILPNGKIIRSVSESNLTNNFVTYLNSEEINLPLYVRNYRLGDKMTIKNMVGHKKVKDIFINEKVSIEDRGVQPIVVDSSGEIVWLPGVKKSAFDSQNTTKYDIILEYH